MALIDFTLSNTRRFYSSIGNPLGWKGLTVLVRELDCCEGELKKVIN